MKVILLRDVAKLGRRHSIVDVPDGYGVNKLIPQGLAKPATPENVKAVLARAGAVAHQAEVSALQFREVLRALETKVVIITAGANDTGRLFEAVKPEGVAHAISKASGHEISVRDIAPFPPIKSTGNHTVTLVHGADHGEVTIVVAAA